MQCNHLVIGAGVVGLAVAKSLAQYGSTIVVDRHDRLVAETSSRNSQVIHAGIYYPEGSLKERLCLEGKAELWRLADLGYIPAQRCGKWIVACSDEEEEKLSELAGNMARLDVPYHFLSQKEAAEAEPHVKAQQVLVSPSTGIADVHAVASYCENVLTQQAKYSDSSFVALNHEVIDINRGAPRHQVLLRARADGSNDKDSAETFTLECDVLVNCAGLHATRIEAMILNEEPPQSPKKLRQHFWRGRYASCRKRLVNRLIYPCPLPGLQGLGTHATIDLSGALRFGPDTQFIGNRSETEISRGVVPPEEILYRFDEADSEEYLSHVHEAVTRYLPAVAREDLTEDFIGVRPKLTAPGEGFRDFMLVKGGEQENPEAESPSVAGTVVSCVGIESPGFTASLAIGNYVAKELLRYGRG